VPAERNPRLARIGGALLDLRRRRAPITLARPGAAALSKLDRETVRRIARLARIRVEENEFEPLAGELSKILGFVEQLSQVDTAAVEPLAAINGLTLPWREDRVADGGKADDVLANAPARAQGYYAVPKVVE